MLFRKISTKVSNVLFNVAKCLAYGDAYYNIGDKILPKTAPRALVLYTTSAIPDYLNGKLYDFPYINSHSMYWESAEMVRLLNEYGYIVDYISFKEKEIIDWVKYDLIIDSWNFLKDCPINREQKKVFYCTGGHWFTHNMGELRRIEYFYDRHGIYIEPMRQIPAICSAEYANYLTYFGNSWQSEQYNSNLDKHLLNISSVFLPEYVEKNIETARYNFLWIGGGGMIHKGLDLVIEAFCKIPNAGLHIVGHPQSEPKFWNWMKPIVERHTNIFVHGWLDVSSEKFHNIADSCISVVYASVSEGGPGAVAQALHHGLIPIVTRSSSVRAEKLGYVIDCEKDIDIINGINEKVQIIINESKSELSQKGQLVREFALNNHTRQAYSESFSQLLQKLAK